MPRAGRALVLAAALALAACSLAACTPSAGPPTSPAVTPAAVPATLAHLGRATVTLGELRLAVAVADDPESRRRGLMGVAELGLLDGLLFAYPAPVEAAFVMRGVSIPLDIAFVDAGGLVVAVGTMVPCLAEPCPAYGAPAPIQWAIEAPAGALEGVVAGDELRIGP